MFLIGVCRSVWHRSTNPSHCKAQSFMFLYIFCRTQSDSMSAAAPPWPWQNNKVEYLLQKLNRISSQGWREIFKRGPQYPVWFCVNCCDLWLAKEISAYSPGAAVTLCARIRFISHVKQSVKSDRGDEAGTTVIYTRQLVPEHPSGCRKHSAAWRPGGLGETVGASPQMTSFV